jgi:hypothetical protein
MGVQKNSVAGFPTSHALTSLSVRCSSLVIHVKTFPRLMMVSLYDVLTPAGVKPSWLLPDRCGNLSRASVNEYFRQVKASDGVSMKGYGR